MAVIVATLTNQGLDAATKTWGGASVMDNIDEFKIGEGGWEEVTAGKVPRTPDPTLTDLDVIENPTRYPVDRRGSFSKVLTGGEISYPANGQVSASCVVALGEFNDNGSGNDPELYEIGLFANGTMIAYGTFAKQDKNPAVSLTNTVTIALSLA